MPSFVVSSNICRRSKLLIIVFFGCTSQRKVSAIYAALGCSCHISVTYSSLEEMMCLPEDFFYPLGNIGWIEQSVIVLVLCSCANPVTVHRNLLVFINFFSSFPFNIFWTLFSIFLIQLYPIF